MISPKQLRLKQLAENVVKWDIGMCSYCQFYPVYDFVGEIGEVFLHEQEGCPLWLMLKAVKEDGHSAGMTLV